ncbi:MAG TPA: T9SS type A sorting domain-containing protein [Flavobacteriales bacterium]|nr:T9SS type A sorting domain-containing protein [Flavobacteriales bacterium]
MLWGIAFLVSTSQVKGQFNVYHPFPDSNAVWGMTSWCMDGQCGDAAHIQNSYAGDTLIDGFQYKRIQEIFVMTSSNGCCYPPENLGSGFLREDTIAKKVYWRSEAMAGDTLLYDFDVQVGDTLTGYMGSCDMTWTVGSIDSILIDLNYRKRINYEVSFDPGIQFSIIEGIGSTYGLTTCPFVPFEMGIFLSCYTVDGDLLYPPSGADMAACGDLTSAVDPHMALGSSPLTCMPNPATDRLVLQCDVSRLPLDVSVVDLTGVVHLRYVLNMANSAIDISSLSSGVYFLHAVRRGTLVTTEMFIKQ